MGKSLRDEMPWTAGIIDELRAEFGKDVIDQQIRRGIKGEPVFWARENGHTIGARNMASTVVIEWDEYGIARSRPADWIIEARQYAKDNGIQIEVADPDIWGDDKREAQQLRDMIEARGVWKK